MNYARAIITRLPLLALCALAGLPVLTTGCGSRAGAIEKEDEGLIVVRRDETGDPRTMDPHVSGDVVSSRHCGLTYECLFQFDYLKRPATLVPCLAAEMPDYDEEKLTYTFRIRDDVYFQDDRCFHPDARGKGFRDSGEGEGKQDVKGEGRKLTARDFEYSLKRLAALDDGGFWVIEGKIEGLDKFRDDALALSGEGPVDDPDKKWRDHLNTAEVAGIDVIDDHTFTVTMTEPYPQFLYAITLSYGAAVAREAVDYYGRDFFRKPVGTGPYVLTSWRPNWELVWDRNPRFREEFFPTSDRPEDQVYKDLMGRKLPIADRIDFRVIKESQPSFLNFRKGLLDISGISKDQFDVAVTPQSEITPELKAQGIKLQKYAEPTIHYISFNMTDPVVGEPAGERGRAIRKAFSLCIDREDYIERYLNGRGQPARQLVPPGVKGHQEVNVLKGQRFDPEAGRKVLQDTGFILEGAGDNWVAKYPDSQKQVSFEVLFRSTDEQRKQFGVFLQDAARKVGIKLNVEYMTFAEFLRRAREGKGQSYDAGWIMDYPDAQNMLQLLYGGNKPPGINSSGYDNSRYNSWYDQLAPLDDSNPEELDHKLGLIRQMHEQLDRDTPWVLMEFRSAYKLYHSWHIPPKPNPFAYTYLKFEYSDSAERARKAKEWEERNYFWAFLIGLIMFLPGGLMIYRIMREK